MTVFEKALIEIREIEAISKNLPLDEKDIRKSFFLMLVESLNAFYFGYVFVHISNQIQSGRLKFIGTPSYHITNIICLGRKQWHEGYLRALNRHLVIDAWSVFEIVITSIIHKLLNKEQLNRMAMYQYYEVEKILNRNSSNIDAEVLKVLEKKLKHTHIPIPRKIDCFFKIVKDNYKNDIISHKKFLNFFNHLRNSMHNNFIYLGNDYEYVFNKTTVTFKKGKPIWFSANEADMPFFLLDIVKNLAFIFQSMVNAIDVNVSITDAIFDDSQFL